MSTVARFRASPGSSARTAITIVADSPGPRSRRKQRTRRFGVPRPRSSHRPLADVAESSRTRSSSRRSMTETQYAVASLLFRMRNVYSTRSPTRTDDGSADLSSSRSTRPSIGTNLQSPRSAEARAVCTSPACSTVQTTSRETGTSRTANANSRNPGLKTAGWPRLIGRRADAVRRPDRHDHVAPIQVRVAEHRRVPLPFLPSADGDDLDRQTRLGPRALDRVRGRRQRRSASLGTRPTRRSVRHWISRGR